MLFRLPALLLLVAAAGCSGLPAGASPAQARTEAALATVLAVASAPDPDLAMLAPLVAAQGEDLTRRWRAPSDLGNAAEAATVRDLATELQALLATVETDGRFGYVAEEFVIEPEAEGPWHVVRARFDDGRQTEIEAAFLPVGGGLLLGRLDR